MLFFVLLLYCVYFVSSWQRFQKKTRWKKEKKKFEKSEVFSLDSVGQKKLKQKMWLYPPCGHNKEKMNYIPQENPI